LANRKVMAAKALIVLGLAACALGSYNAGYGYSYAPQNYGYGYTIGGHGYHKREAEPSYSPALAYHPAGGYGYSQYGPGYSYTDRSPQGLHKREAEPSYAPALAYHPAGGYGYKQYGPGYSYTDRSPQGARLHKRQVAALLGAGLLAGGLAVPYGRKYSGINYRNGLRYYKREAEPSYAPALAYHPAGEYGYNKYGAGYSYTDRSPQGLHKREAEPSYAPALAYHPAGEYGYNKYGAGYSYTDRSPQGIHKREAEPSHAPALAYHPAGEYGYNKYGPGYSYTDRSPQGARLHKRQLVGGSALTLLGLQALGYGLAGQTGLLNNNRYRYGKREAEPSYAPALAYHPAGEYGYNKYGPGYSYTDRSPQGARLHKRQLVGGSALTLAGLQLLGYGLAGQTGLLNNNRNRFRGKREAEPSYAPALAYHPAGGYGYNNYGPGYSYTDRSPQGLHKREASGNSYQSLIRTDCYGYNCQNTEYGVKVNGYNAHVYENREGH